MKLYKKNYFSCKDVKIYLHLLRFCVIFLKNFHRKNSYNFAFILKVIFFEASALSARTRPVLTIRQNDFTSLN